MIRKWIVDVKTRPEIQKFNSGLGKKPRSDLEYLCAAVQKVLEPTRQPNGSGSQLTVYDQRSPRMPGRIVSVSQTHVRPIVRGKAGAPAEFGAKLSVSLVNGYASPDRIRWEAYNESQDVAEQVEGFREQFEHYPEGVIAEGIYGSRANRQYLKQRGIRFSGKPLDRPPADAQERKAARQQRRQEATQRNRIEGKFGEGKRKYQLDCVRIRRQDTSEHWIAMTFFAMNIAAVLRRYFWAWFFWGFRRGDCSPVRSYTAPPGPKSRKEDLFSNP